MFPFTDPARSAVRGRHGELFLWFITFSVEDLITATTPESDSALVRLRGGCSQKASLYWYWWVDQATHPLPG